MNSFDLAIIRLITSVANASPAFDRFVNFLLNLEVAKGGVAMALFWAAWFHPGHDEEHRRQVLMETLIATFVALLVTVTLSMVLPFRLRPLLAFQTAGMEASPDWWELSAFPSDHATLFFALAVGLLRVAPRLGWLAVGHAIVVVSLPRIYVGLHYPTDILGGAAIGMLITYGFTGTALLRRPSARLLTRMKQSPASFYASLFLCSYLIATLFVDLRRSAAGLYRYLTQ